MDMSDNDATDARKAPTGSSSPQLQPSRKTCPSNEKWSATDHYNLSYPSMGKFVIINNKIFDPSTGLKERKGTDLDAEKLKLIFQELKFDVTVHHNQTKKQMENIFKDLGKEDHSRSASFGCAILSHGEDGVIWGTDKKLEIENITKSFKGDQCKSLVGKPKFFFIQACRGKEFMEGVSLDPFTDAFGSSDVGEKLPVESDFLVAYSVVPGFFSWRNTTKGSWFIQALCACLVNHGKSLDMLRLLTRVNKQVALDFESNSSDPDMHQKKQIPCITSMLTKDFYLDPSAILGGLPALFDKKTSINDEETSNTDETTSNNPSFCATS